jgi:hypothetical protein
MPTNHTSAPPYLDYGVPADLKKIQDKINAVRKTVLLRKGAVLSSAELAAQLPAGIKTPRGAFDPSKIDVATVQATTVDPSKLDPSIPKSPPPGRTGRSFAAGNIAQFQPAGASPAPAPASAAPVPTVTVSPNGVVALGFNCRRGFSATATEPSFKPDYVTFSMLLKKPGGGWDQIFFLGVYPGGDPDFFPATVHFEHYFETYKTMAYASASKTVVFIVECKFYDLTYSSNPVQVAQSAPATLDFNGPSCLGIHSMAVSADTFVGGENDQEPTLTVAMDGPAGPGGQKVALRTSNSNLATIMGSGSFVILAGQTSGSISWFLGTREVFTTGKSFHIEAELVSPSGTSPKGVIEIWLTKKPKKIDWPW